MKTTFLFLFLSLAACGTAATQSKTAPVTESNAAVEAAVAHSAPQSQGMASWPSNGAIDCNIVLDTRFTATYHIAISPTQRSVHVAFRDAFTGGDYTGDNAFGMAELNATDSVVRRNADFASIGVYETDFGKGHTRWWGFALDIATLTAYANDAVLDQSPPIDAGWVAGVASTDCHYTP